MKIGLIVPGFSSHEQDWCIPALLDYVRVLARQAEVHVFTLRWPERGGGYAVYGAAVHALDGRKNMGPQVLALYSRALRALSLEHRRAPFDVLHAFWADEPGWVAAWAGRRLRVPVVASLAGGELVGFRDLGYGMLLLPGRSRLIRWALDGATLITAGSQYMLGLARAFLPRSQWGKLMLAPLGVDTGRFSPREGKQEGRKKTILNVGSLYPVKGQAVLLCAFAALDQLPEACLHIAGEGPLRRSLEALALELGIRDRVEFLGEVHHGQMPEVYREADLFVQSSWHEAQGMAALEAAACGLPVVGTAVGLLPEIGVGVQAGDDHALSTIIGQVLGRGESRTRSDAQFELSLESCMLRFEDLYRSLSSEESPT